MSEELIIRKATHKDKVAIMSLVTAFYGESAPEMVIWWGNNYNQISDKPLIAQLDNEVIAYIASSTDYESNSVYIGDLYVKPSFRKKGIATKLVQEVEIIAENTHRKLRVDVRKVDQEARKLYKRLGFTLLEEKNKESLKLIKNTK